MDAVTVFNFQDQHEVRTVIRNGEPWFVAKDVCEILSLDNVSQALVALGDDEKISIRIGGAKSTTYVNTITNSDGIICEENVVGNPNMLAVSESGLYALVFKSRKPEAQAFRKWVTSEVLPAIRKTGAYVLPRSELLNKEVAAREFAALKAVAELCGLEGNAAIVSADNAIRREHGISLLQTLQIELKNSDQKYFFSPTQIAEMLHLSGPREVNKLLEIGGYQVKSGGQWLPTEKGKAYAVLLDTGKRHSSGVMIQQLKWKETVLDVLK